MKYLIIILLLFGFKSQAQTKEQIDKFCMYVDSMGYYNCLFKCEKPESKKKITYLSLKYMYQDSATKYYNTFPLEYIHRINRIDTSPTIDTCKCN